MADTLGEGSTRVGSGVAAHWKVVGLATRGGGPEMGQVAQARIVLYAH